MRMRFNRVYSFLVRGDRSYFKPTIDTHISLAVLLRAHESVRVVVLGGWDGAATLQCAEAFDGLQWLPFPAMNSPRECASVRRSTMFCHYYILSLAP